MRTFITLILLLCLAPSVPANNLSLPEQGTDPQFGQRRNETSPDVRQIERDRVRALNKERQQKLKQDTDKLLQLATELKQYVDKTNENIMSLEVIRKTDEIEKLAKSVREKMKTAYEMPQDDRLSPR